MIAALLATVKQLAEIATDEIDIQFRVFLEYDVEEAPAQEQAETETPDDGADDPLLWFELHNRSFWQSEIEYVAEWWNGTRQWRLPNGFFVYDNCDDATPFEVIDWRSENEARLVLAEVA